MSLKYSAVAFVCAWITLFSARADSAFPVGTSTPDSQAQHTADGDPDFGFLALGQSAADTEFWGTNVGTLTFFSVTLTGSPEFQLTANTCNGAVVDHVGHTCVTQVTFTPNAVGLQTAALVLQTSSGVFSFPYQGTGLAPGATPPAIDPNQGVGQSNNGLNLNQVYSGIPLTQLGYSVNSDTHYCLECGEPVNLATGTLWHSETDFILKGRTSATELAFKRSYVEFPVFGTGDFGPRWMHNWETKILSETSSQNSNLVWIDPSGGAYVFTRRSDNSFQSPPGFFGTLTEYSDHYDMKQKFGVHYIFARNSAGVPTGRLLRVVEPHGETVELSYVSGQLQSVSTGLAGAIQFSRNAQGRVIAVTRVRDGLTHTFGYDNQNRLSSASDFDGNVSRYGYINISADPTPGGLLQYVMDPLGRVYSNVFDSNGQVIDQYEPGNAHRSYAYTTEGGRPVTTVREINNTYTTYAFTPNSLLENVYYPDGAAEFTSWTSQNQIARFTDSLGYTTTYTYDSNGNRTGVKKPLDPSATTASYDTIFDRVKAIVPLVGAPTAVDINPNTGDALQIRKFGSSSTLSEAFSYDSFGNAIGFSNGIMPYATQTDSNGLTTALFDLRNPEHRQYDGRGRVISRIFGSGRTLSYIWDNHDRILQINDSAGPSFGLEYDVLGRVVSKTISDGHSNHVTRYERDARGRITASIDSLGKRTLFVYDQSLTNGGVVDQPVSKIDANGNVISYSYDSRDRIVKTTDSRGAVTTYQYNLRGEKIGLVDSLGQATSIVYDGNGRVISIKEPSTSTDAGGVPHGFVEVTHLSYDLAGKPIKRETITADGGKAVTTLTYDDFGRIVRRVTQRISSNGAANIEDDSRFEFANELDRVLITKASNSNSVIDIEYDPAPPYLPTAYSIHAPAGSGNPLGLIEGNFAIKRDSTNGISQLIGPNSKVLYSVSHNLAAQITQLSSGSYVTAPGGALSFALSYDGFGRKIAMLASTGEKEVISYDVLNRVSNIDWLDSKNKGLLGAILNSILDNKTVSENISYDPAGNILNEQREFANFSYSYDQSRELLNVNASSIRKQSKAAVDWSFDETFSYDAEGNRSFASTDGKAAEFLNNQITKTVNQRFESSSDGLGNLAVIASQDGRTKKKMSYRADGRLQAYELAYDPDWDGDDDSDDAIVTKAEYFYDAFRRRLAKKVTERKWEPCKISRWSRKRKLAAKDFVFVQSYSHLADQDRIVLGKSDDGLISVYLDGQGIDEHFGKVSSREKFAYKTDHLGSVLNSAPGGAYQTFSPYGKSTLSGQIMSQIRHDEPVMYGFAGRQFDPESGFYYSRARTYSPELGRFLQKDPIWPLSGTNPYSYAFNSPLNLTDPYGLCALQVGVSGSYTYLGISYSFGYGIAFDDSGNIGSYSVPGGANLALGEGFSFGTSFEYSENANTLFDLSGAFFNSTAAFGAGVSAGFDSFYGYVQDPNGGIQYPVSGAGITLGVGAGVSASTGYNYTLINSSFNIFDF